MEPQKKMGGGKGGAETLLNEGGGGRVRNPLSKVVCICVMYSRITCSSPQNIQHFPIQWHKSTREKGGLSCVFQARDWLHSACLTIIAFRN